MVSSLLEFLRLIHAKLLVISTVRLYVSRGLSYQYFSARLCEKSKYSVENIFLLLGNNTRVAVPVKRAAAFVLTNLQAQTYSVIILN